MPDVAIRGMGLVCCYGRGLAPAVAALRAGRPGNQPLARFSLPFSEAVPLNPIDHGPYPPGAAGGMAIILDAARQALHQAGLDGDAPALRDCALLLGSSGFLYLSEANYHEQLKTQQNPTPPALHAPGRVAAGLAQTLKIGGPVFTLSTACSSSANALLVATDLLARGECSRALVIGAEGLSAISLSGFHSLLLLDPAGCRPFDAARRGLQLGEAVGALLLEPSGAADTLRLLGGANRCDIHHVTSARPDGAAMRATMDAALAHGRCAARDIVAIKAHGTGSLDNDAAEAAAMRALFHEAPPPFTALKRYLGHTLGACGAVETAAFAACLQAGFIPLTVGFEQVDPALGVQPLTHSIPARPGHYLLNFFGFGGNYASLVLAHG